MKLYCAERELRTILANEAIDALTKKPVKSTTLERIRLFTYADEHVVCGLPQPLQYGLGLKYVLENISIPIKPYDLILGRIQEEVPDEEGERFFQEVCERYKRDCLPWDKGTMPFWVFDQGHTSFYWRDVIQLGLVGLKRRAEKQLEQHRANHSSEDTLNYLQGAIYVYEAIQAYLIRYAEAALNAGLNEAAEACLHAAVRAPQGFREALQLLYTISFIYCSMLAGNPTLTYGRLDLFLKEIYEADIKSGKLTRADAGLLILDYYAKNNLNMGRGEHQLSINDESLSTGWQRCLNFDAPQYLYIGGTAWDGTSACSDLTQQFAEEIVPRFKNPVVLVRYAKGMMTDYPTLWETLVTKMRDSASMMVYNEQDVISAYLRAGVDPEDAFDFEHHGCNWPNIPGRDGGFSNHLYMWARHMKPEDWAYFNSKRSFWGIVPRLVMETLHRINDVDIPNVNLDTLFDTYKSAIRPYFEEVLESVERERECMLREAPGVLLFMDCFFKDCILQAKNSYTGGCKYFTTKVSFGGFATAADSMITVDELVFRRHIITLKELIEAVDDNFEHYPQVLALCRSVPKLGSDDTHANEIASRFLKLLTNETSRLTEKINKDEWPRIVIRQSIESDTGHIRIGAMLGATPDGRLAGMPVSQNCQPSVGASCNGLTSRLMSMASLPFDRIMSGAQNISIQPRLFAGETGLRNLAALIGTYFEMGGLQTQISAVDIEELYDAQRNPDKHRDLMVRVTGYSAVFVDMIKKAQDDIIKRESSGL